MSEPMTEPVFDLKQAISQLVTEDDTPVDNILSEKQQRLLTDTLYESWTPPPAEDEEESSVAPVSPRLFWASANVGIFRSLHMPAIVPDVFVSLDITAPPDLRTTDQRSYFMWEHGKPPEAVIEIVSNRKGQELGGKLRDYGRMGVLYYAVYDPMGELRAEMGGKVLQVYELLFGRRYRRRDDDQLPELGLELILWDGRFEDSENSWLRWRDLQGNLLLTGHEHAALESAARREAEDRASQAEGRASEAEDRASEAEG
ncbi:MAG: Uma2 family endonuclease, partial [Blastocatellia bacterium]